MKSTISTVPLLRSNDGFVSRGREAELVQFMRKFVLVSNGKVGGETLFSEFLGHLQRQKKGRKFDSIHHCLGGI